MLRCMGYVECIVEVCGGIVRCGEVTMDRTLSQTTQMYLSAASVDEKRLLDK